MSVSFGRAAAIACLRGECRGRKITGTVRFYPYCSGVLVAAELHGLPDPDGIYAFHIHEGRSCEGRGFPETGGHFDPEDRPHPEHAGDLPPIFSYGGRAFMAVYTGRFTIPEIIGRTVVLHAQPDDFTTQPSGAAGAKIACGEIRRVGCR